jgi:hypothetical protein
LTPPPFGLKKFLQSEQSALCRGLFRTKIWTLMLEQDFAGSLEGGAKAGQVWISAYKAGQLPVLNSGSLAYSNV